MGLQSGSMNFYEYVGNNPLKGTDPSGLLEVDDRPNAPGNMTLRNVGSVIEAMVNGEISAARLDAKQMIQQGLAPTNESLGQLVARKVYEQLGANVSGTGLGPLRNKGMLNEFEVKFIQYLDLYRSSPSLLAILPPESNPTRTQLYNRMTFAQSKYGDNIMGLEGVAPSMLNETTMNHSIAPTIRVGNTIVGLDKFGHFFQQGYWLYFGQKEGFFTSHAEREDFSLWLEGANHQGFGVEGLGTNTEYPRSEENQSRYRKFASRFDEEAFTGYFGLYSSGVASGADVHANEAGFQFYQALANDPLGYRFRLADINISQFNESTNAVEYVPGLKVRK
jgi:hypothetical protein